MYPTRVIIVTLFWPDPNSHGQIGLKPNRQLELKFAVLFAFVIAVSLAAGAPYIGMSVGYLLLFVYLSVRVRRIERCVSAIERHLGELHPTRSQQTGGESCDQPFVK